MSLESIWRKEMRRRVKDDLQRSRIRLNWPSHARIIYSEFGCFAEMARRDGVMASVAAYPSRLQPADEDDYVNELGEFPLGTSEITLRFGMEPTGEGVLRSTKDYPHSVIDYEDGAMLVVHFSTADSVVQVFFQPPRMLGDDDGETLLFTHAYDPDKLTRKWVRHVVRAFLIFNRAESRLGVPSFTDTWRLRWWRFRDIRNRRGYLEKFRHLLTPWELVIIATIAGLPVLAGAQALLKLLTP